MVDPALSATTRDEDLLIPVGGETVSATRVAPADRGGPLPAVLIYTPYRKDDFATAADGGTLIEYVAGAGYHVVIADIVGTGASSGRKSEPFQEREGAEAAEIVEWLADRTWTTGRIGMTGMSYPGMTSLRGAVEGPEPLEAVVPIMAPFFMYQRADRVSDSHYAGGVLSYQAGASWHPLMATLQALPPGRRDDDGRWAAVWEERLGALEEHTPWLFQYLDHESPKDSYWDGKDITAEAVEGIDVPTFLVDGWRDSFVHDNVACFGLIDAPKRLLVGPWRHKRPYQGRETRVDFRPQVVEWFDRFLKDEDSGALDRPAVAYWTEREGGGTEAGTWRGADRWPPAPSEPIEFALSAGGLTPAEGTVDPVERAWEADHTVGLDSTARYGPPRDTAADDARSLCFETAVDRPVEFTGAGEATLRVVPETGDPFLTVRVVDVSPGGAASLVTYGYLRASHRDGHADPDPLEPEEPATVGVPLKPTSHVFEADHRIRVAVSGALFPIALPPRDAGGFALRSTPEEPSTVTLRGRRHDGTVAFDDTVEMGGFDDRIPATSPSVRSESTLETSREHLADRGTFRQTAETTYDLPAGGTATREREMTGTVLADDPLSAVYRAEFRATIDRDERVEAVQRSRVTRDATHLTVLVTVEGDPVFERTWRR